jgi:hypothetical protein
MKDIESVGDEGGEEGRSDAHGNQQVMAEMHSWLS